MSVTYEIVCHTCKQKYWAGQSLHIYDKEKLGLFLHDHQNHKLEFTDDQNEDIYDYQDWAGDEMSDGLTICSSCGCEDQDGKSCTSCNNVFREHVDIRISKKKEMRRKK